RDLLPHRLPEVVAEADPALGYALGEEDPPAILGHADVVEVRPAARIDRHGGAQVDRVLLEALRAHLAPPGEEVRLPLLERALQALVGGQVHVVRDLLAQLHAHGLTSSAGRARAAGRPSRRAPARPSPRSRSAARRSSSATPRAGRRSWSRASPGRGSGGSPPGRSARRGSSPRAPRSPGAPPPPSRGRRGRR